MKKIFLFSLILFNASFMLSQRTCGMQAYMNQVWSDPILTKEYLERQAKFEIEYQKLLQQEEDYKKTGLRSPNVTKIIPVAVHFPSVPNSSSASVKTCLRALAQSQINVINADYNAANTDISNWTAASTFYPGVTTGNLDVQFVIATQNHPAGTGIPNGTVAVTFGTDFLVAGNPNCSNGCNNDATWAGYMNFVVKDIGSQLLGFSPPGGYPSAGNSVVMNTICFGKGAGCSGYVPQSPYNLGRTVTHELGHFFNLDHTFANDNGCGGSDDDEVTDTPRCGFANYGCVTNGSVAGCVSGQKQLTMNYMDYSDDACMYMFSNGQKVRALAYLNTIYGQYKTNVLSNLEVNTIDFTVYPNPSNGVLNIQLTNLASDYSVEVYDAMGREVDFTKNDNANIKSIDLKNVAKGIYYVTIASENKQTTKKIIVE